MHWADSDRRCEGRLVLSRAPRREKRRNMLLERGESWEHEKSRMRTAVGFHQQLFRRPGKVLYIFF